MVPGSVSSVNDRWGEPRAQTSGTPDEVKALDRAKGRRLWWLIGTLGGMLVLAGALWVARRAAIRSLSAACREANQAEDWERLDALAGRWCMLEWDKAAPLIYRAEAANQTGQWEDAVELLGALPDDDPMTPPALLKCSEILYGPLNRAVEGAEALERAIEIDPKYTEARRRLIYFYAFTLQRRRMVDLAYDTIQHDCDQPETYVYLMLQDSLSFSNGYEENTRWFMGDRDEELFLVARAIYRIRARGLDEAGNPEDGPRDEEGTPYHRTIVAEYFERFPDNLELLAYFLQLSSTAGDVDEVGRLLARAPQQAADDNRFWRYMGWLHMARGELHHAQESYEKALSLNPYDHISRHQLASVERRQKRPERVEALEQMAREGKAVRREILQLESVDKVPPRLLGRMAVYAEACGDDIVASQLYYRIEQWSDVWSRGRTQTAPAPAVDAR
jgi:tetratricopeptide (TPR) repeat protein